MLVYKDEGWRKVYCVLRRNSEVIIVYLHLWTHHPISDKDDVAVTSRS